MRGDGGDTSPRSSELPAAGRGGGDTVGTAAICHINYRTPKTGRNFLGNLDTFIPSTKVQDMRMFPAERGDQALVLAQPSHQQIAPIIASNMLADLTTWMENILT